MIHRFFKPRNKDPRSQTLWLTVYADLMTNLMLVFLALFGLMLMGDEAIMKAMQSIRSVAADKSLFSKEIQFQKLTNALGEELEVIPGITVEREMDATRISFGESVLFESGHAELKTSAGAALKSLATYLEILPYTVVVEGHTDNVPIKAGGKYKNNYELSLARAMSVVSVMVENHDLPQDQFAAAAYGSFRAIGDNTTVDGRQKNRRVEIALFKDFPYEL